MDIEQHEIKTNNERSETNMVGCINNAHAGSMEFDQDCNKKISTLLYTESKEAEVSDVVSAKNNHEANQKVITRPDTVNECHFSHSKSFVKTEPTAATIQNEIIPSIASSGLSMLSQYESDPEDILNPSMIDSFVTNPESVGCDTYRRNRVEIDSSSTSDSDSEYLTVLRKEINKSVQLVDDEDDDDIDENRQKRQALKVKGEILLEDLPPIQDLQISVPEEECVELGQVNSIVDQLVLVNVLPNSMLLDLETILFLEKGQKVLGAIFDVLGQVSNPLYCVRFNTNEQIKERKINIGDLVYCAPKTQHTQFVILSKLMQIRGSDASWENDIEPPSRHLDYSDDEQEREARTKQRNRDQPTEYIDPRQRKRSNELAFDNIAKTHSRKYVHKNQYHSSKTGRESFRMGYDLQNFAGDNHCSYYPNYNSDSWHSNYYLNCHPPMPNSVQVLAKQTSYQHYNGTTSAYENHPPCKLPYQSYGPPPHSES